MPYYPPATGSGSGQSWVSNRSLSPAPNGSTTLFTTPEAYIAGTTRLYLNGQRLFLTGDYTETSSNSLTFTVAPYTADMLLVDYRTV